MKKLISTLFVSVALIGFMKAQLITNFETAPLSITSWGGDPGTPPVVGTDPADASNHVLKIQRDSDNTFNQTTVIKVAPVTLDAASTLFKIRIKGAASGCWTYIKLWNSATKAKIGEAWVGGNGNDTTKAGVWVDLINSTILAAGTVDSIMINIGSWNNGNAPAGKNGTYYIDSIAAYANTVPIVYVPKAKKFAHAIHLEAIDDTVTFDGVANEQSWADASMYNINDGASDTTFGTGTFQAAWDNNYVYFFVSVKKPTPTPYDEISGNAWKEDGIQLYFDVHNKLIVEGIAKTQVQLTLPLKAKYFADLSPYAGNSASPGDSIYTPADTTKTRQEGIFMYKKDVIIGTSKYNSEIRVPFASMFWDGPNSINTFAKCLAAKNAKSPTSGDTLGFEAQVNMWNTLTSARDGVNTWSQASDTGITVGGKYYHNVLGSYQNSGQWGGLILDPDTFQSGVKTLSASNLKVYPNPSVSYINVVAKGMQQISVFNTVGQVMIVKNVSSDKEQVSVANLVKGIYLIQVKTLNGVINKKFLKN